MGRFQLRIPQAGVSLVAVCFKMEIKMLLNKKQMDVKEKIEIFSKLIGVDPILSDAVGFVESSFGMNQKSPTGCRGVFQMSSIAMKDLLWEMENVGDEWEDICCGILYLRILLRRHKDVKLAVSKFCDPKDRSFYVERVIEAMKEFL